MLNQVKTCKKVTKILYRISYHESCIKTIIVSYLDCSIILNILQIFLQSVFECSTLLKVGSDGTVYIELNGPRLTPTLPIRPRRLPAPPPEVMAHSNSMYALVDHKPRIPPPPPNDIWKLETAGDTIRKNYSLEFLHEFRLHSLQWTTFENLFLLSLLLLFWACHLSTTCFVVTLVFTVIHSYRQSLLSANLVYVTICHQSLEPHTRS
jgi:hypothetical protein